jgi:hypothetical protein
VNAGDEEVVSQEEGGREGSAAGGEEGGCCCASAIAIAHTGMRAHRARENSTRLGRRRCCADRSRWTVTCLRVPVTPSRSRAGGAGGRLLPTAPYCSQRYTPRLRVEEMGGDSGWELSEEVFASEPGGGGLLFGIYKRARPCAVPLLSPYHGVSLMPSP